MEILRGMRLGSRQDFLVLAVQYVYNGHSEYTYVLTFRDQVWEFTTHAVDTVNGELHHGHYFNNLQDALNDLNERGR